MHLLACMHVQQSNTSCHEFVLGFPSGTATNQPRLPCDVYAAASEPRSANRTLVNDVKIFVGCLQRLNDVTSCLAAHEFVFCEFY